MPALLRQRRLSIKHPSCYIASLWDSQYLLLTRFPPAFLLYHLPPESYPLVSWTLLVGQKSCKVFVPSPSSTPKGQCTIGLGNMVIAVGGEQLSGNLGHVLFWVTNVLLAHIYQSICYPSRSCMLSSWPILYWMKKVWMRSLAVAQTF